MLIGLPGAQSLWPGDCHWRDRTLPASITKAPPPRGGAPRASLVTGPRDQRAADLCRHRVRGRSMRNQLPMAMAKMMTRRTNSVSP